MGLTRIVESCIEQCMKKIPFLFFLILVGCIGNNTLFTSSMATDNISNLSRVSKGMKETEVFKIMKHPYKEENISLSGDQYVVWFYITRVTGLGQTRMVPLNLTPLVFKNGTLIAWGYSYYDYLLEQQKIERGIKEIAPPKQKGKTEDKGLEKALEGLKAPSPKIEQEKPVQERGGDKEVSMSRPPKKEKPSEKSDDSKDDFRPLDEKDEKMIEEENEQNFNYW